MDTTPEKTQAIKNEEQQGLLMLKMLACVYIRTSQDS